MGYRIEYAGEAPVKEKPITGRTGLRMMTAAGFLIFSISVRLLWPDGTSVLQSVFLPGALNTTEQAFSQLVTDLREGDPLTQSLDVFCRSVIHGSS